ncbi:MAG TPA: amylo-alpha-1,6-glucosidase [Myxococcales bacterium]|nr:amylo-alpha-1,6-glucosidase [Myxococcales bacterium]
MLSVDRKACEDYARSSRLEWLETNGAGGFAMGTVAGTNTRRYHALLVASLRPPVDRHVLLSRLDEVVSADGLPDVALASNQYPGTIAPQGYTHLIEFRLDPFPTWVFDVGGAHVEKQLFMVPGEQAVVVQYRATRPRRLSVSPFLAFRDYHSLTHANGSLDGDVREERTPGALVLRIKPYASLPELSLHASPGAHFQRDGCWYFDNEYLVELDRGLDFREDLWKAGTLALQLEQNRPAFIVAAIGSRRFDAAEVAALEAQVREQRRGRDMLDLAADQFIARRADGKPTLMAGFPWFTDWGRDTMISLPGIFLARGKLDQARDVLRGFLAHLDGGLIPNRFPDSPTEEPEYNTVDATLWMFQAVFGFLESGGDARFLRDDFYPAAKQIIDWHIRGTRHGIRVDPSDRLLAAGEPGVQLTWMDAKVGDRVVTPRHGKPVEINALWHNALRLMARWGRALGDEPAASRFAVEAAMVAGSFQRAFWNRERGCLLDVVGPDDPAIRPNQLIALSLPFPLLNAEQRKSVVRVVERELLTPVGLRTLATSDPAYIGRYGGGGAQRDGAYHQGTVWPWLLGPYVRAYLAAFGRDDDTVRHCRGLLRGLEQHLSEACLGSVSEVFDGDAPHRPGGAPAQAWSVAELIRLLAVDLADQPRAPTTGAPQRL